MSKRVRGPIRTHRRPGARAPSERVGTRRREFLPSEDASQLDLATEIAEDIVEESPSAVLATPAAERATVARRTPTRIHHKIKAGSILAARAATEYVYVAQDLRRIIAVSVGLIALMFVLWLLIVVMRVIELPFY